MVSDRTVSAGFEPVRERFEQYLAEDEGFSAQLHARWKGDVVVDLAGGSYLDRDSLTGVFSVTKGVAAVALATLIDDERLDLDAPVAGYWPEFGAAGKARVTVRALLSHQAGLPNLDPVLTPEEYRDSSLAAARLAAARPVWEPGSAFGYHGLIIGVFIEELVRRITGGSVQELYESRIRGPRGIDFFLGLPEALEGRYRPVLPMVPTSDQQAELDSAPPAPDGMMALAFDALPGGGAGVAAVLPHTPSGRALGFSAVGGVGSARGIADVYAAALEMLSPPTIERISQEQVSGIDRVLNAKMAFASVFMKPQPRIPFASYRAFGHDGAGGALGFADPMHDLAFGYIPMPMQYPGGADWRSVELSLLIRECIVSLAK